MMRFRRREIQNSHMTDYEVVKVIAHMFQIPARAPVLSNNQPLSLLHRFLHFLSILALITSDNLCLVPDEDMLLSGSPGALHPCHSGHPPIRSADILDL